MHHSFLILAPTEQLETSPYMHTNTHTDNFIHHISKLQWCTLASTTAPPPPPTPTHPPSPVFLSLPKGLPELQQPVIKSIMVQATLSDILGATTYSHSTPGTGCTRQQQSRGSWSCAWPCSRWGRGSSAWRRTRCLCPASCCRVPGSWSRARCQTRSSPSRSTVSWNTQDAKHRRSLHGQLCFHPSPSSYFVWFLSIRPPSNPSPLLTQHTWRSRHVHSS